MANKYMVPSKKEQKKKILHKNIVFYLILLENIQNIIKIKNL
jgi:hypothetical protein